MASRSASVSRARVAQLLRFGCIAAVGCGLLSLSVAALFSHRPSFVDLVAARLSDSTSRAFARPFLYTGDASTSSTSNRTGGDGHHRGLATRHPKPAPPGAGGLQRKKDLECSRSLLDVWGDSLENKKATWAWPRPVMETFRCNGRMALCCKPAVSVLVLMWTGAPFGAPFMPPDKNNTLPMMCCGGVQISYTTDKSQLDRADIVEFHMYDYARNQPPPPPRRDDQPWMLFNLEGQYKIAGNFPGEFNLWRSYTLASDVFNPYMDVGECQAKRSMAQLDTPFKERNMVPLVAMVSNCQSHVGREGVLRALMNSVETHSLGGCMHNHQATEKGDNRRARVASVMEKYKFAFAVENAICTDYITEKFHRTFRLGLVPIVVTIDEKPGYGRFAPTNFSYLDLSRFKDTRAAAEEINAAAKDEVLFMKYHAYRGPNPTERPSEQYRQNVMMEKDNGLDRTWCRLAEHFRTVEGKKKLTDRRRSDLDPGRQCVGQSGLQRYS